jgi:hypothetical protein
MAKGGRSSSMLKKLGKRQIICRSKDSTNRNRIVLAFAIIREVKLGNVLHYLERLAYLN